MEYSLTLKHTGVELPHIAHLLRSEEKSKWAKLRNTIDDGLHDLAHKIATALPIHGAVHGRKFYPGKHVCAWREDPTFLLLGDYRTRNLTDDEVHGINQGIYEISGIYGGRHPKIVVTSPKAKGLREEDIDRLTILLGLPHPQDVHTPRSFKRAG